MPSVTRKAQGVTEQTCPSYGERLGSRAAVVFLSYKSNGVARLEQTPAIARRLNRRNGANRKGP